MEHLRWCSMSILQVNQIQNTSGTSALTIDGSGNVNIPGHVIQVVTSTASTEIINNTTSEIATDLSASITPSSSANKVFAILTLPIQRGSNSGSIRLDYYLKRGSTTIATGKSMVNVNAIVQLQDEFSLSKLDSPSTTSATTYSVTFKETVQTNRYGNSSVCPDGATATLTLMEIAG